MVKSTALPKYFFGKYGCQSCEITTGLLWFISNSRSINDQYNAVNRFGQIDTKIFIEFVFPGLRLLRSVDDQYNVVNFS